jgi:glycosyltransferase involved in cell wall biosynthesis
MSCSVPVISSNVGGLPEVNIDGETGFVCELADVECMGRCATKILKDEKLHKKMSKAARKRAENFEIDKIVSIYEEYYMEVKSKM